MPPLGAGPAALIGAFPSTFAKRTRASPAPFWKRIGSTRWITALPDPGAGAGGGIDPIEGRLVYWRSAEQASAKDIGRPLASPPRGRARRREPQGSANVGAEQAPHPLVRRPGLPPPQASDPDDRSGQLRHVLEPRADARRGAAMASQKVCGRPSVIDDEERPLESPPGEARSRRRRLPRERPRTIR